MRLDLENAPEILRWLDPSREEFSILTANWPCHLIVPFIFHFNVRELNWRGSFTPFNEFALGFQRSLYEGIQEEVR